MLNIAHRKEELWPADLKPIGYGEVDPEAADAWWQRCAKLMPGLPREVGEQWIYRHWTSTPYKFLDLLALQTEEVRWDTERVLSEVHLEFGGPAEPEHDFKVFAQSPLGPSPTARNWGNCSWAIPIIVLATPDGIVSYDGERPKVTHLLIEGSKRFRYLNALHHRGGKTGPHQVYCLTARNIA